MVEGGLPRDPILIVAEAILVVVAVGFTTATTAAPNAHDRTAVGDGMGRNRTGTTGVGRQCRRGIEVEPGVVGDRGVPPPGAAAGTPTAPDAGRAVGVGKGKGAEDRSLARRGGEGWR